MFRLVPFLRYYTDMIALTVRGVDNSFQLVKCNRNSSLYTTWHRPTWYAICVLT